ncbi:NACHT domain-containing protein [Bradyrhizobium sp. RDM4]|uniref:NACHT domain-containing protein n=1 Tax=Bradyrhizobium sp. RDM4 TaxID=3378765 RepID=UPI0038FCFA84
MPDFEIDVNKLATHAATELIDSFFSLVKGETKDQIGKYKVRFGRGFSRYLTETARRYGQYKTLLNRYDSVSLSTSYVPARARLGEDTLRVEDFLRDFLENKQRLILEGTAGLGKTLFLRYSLSFITQNEPKFIPILFELRHLHGAETLTANLAKLVAMYVHGFTEEHLKFGLERGAFVVLLDGLDELSLSERTRYASEILELCYRYRETPILISSRPDDVYAPWEIFRVARLLPMTREQTVLMLEKLSFDAVIKEKFLSALTPEFFDAHREFLSVPLLSTLMMMTYREFASIPSKLYVFYDQAFQTLFNKHDFIKGAFTRKIESGLDIDRFRKVLSAFCFISYLQEELSFLQHRAIEIIRSALEMTEVECDPEQFLNDLLVTVCILQRDGLYVTFVHRSFQEYFTALFASQRSRSLDMFDFAERLVARGRTDNVLAHALQLNEEAIEQEWILPKIVSIEAKVKKPRVKDIDLAEEVYGPIRYGDGIEFDQKMFRSIRQILNLYSKEPLPEVLPKFIEDVVMISNYADEQAELAREEKPHNKLIVRSIKRGLLFSALPAALRNELTTVKELARSIREIANLRRELEARQSSRKMALGKLLERLRPKGGDSGT